MRHLVLFCVLVSGCRSSHRDELERCFDFKIEQDWPDEYYLLARGHYLIGNWEKAFAAAPYSRCSSWTSDSEEPSFLEALLALRREQISGDRRPNPDHVCRYVIPTQALLRALLNDIADAEWLFRGGRFKVALARFRWLEGTVSNCFEEESELADLAAHLEIRIAQCWERILPLCSGHLAAPR